MHSDIGQTRLYRGQLYKCVDAFPHVTRDGRNVTLLVIHSRCADCYQRFEIRETRHNFQRRSLLRRCDECRKPGAPVDRPVTRNRPKSTVMTVREGQMHQVLVDLAKEQRERVSPNARGWVRTKDWTRALVERGVFSSTEARARFYRRARRRLIEKGRLEVRGPAVRAL
jgi:hypothetical protein